MSDVDRTPSPGIPGLESPIATVGPCPSEPCEIGLGVDITPLPDELAYTGFDVMAPLLGALVLVYAGAALLRGRRA